MMNIDTPCAEKRLHASERLILIYDYGFNNTINTYADSGPKPARRSSVYCQSPIENTFHFILSEFFIMMKYNTH
jgi:hypothetical protein